MVIEFALKDLPSVARKISRRLQSGDVIALSGPLAAGKTTLCSALLTALGYPGQVASPTFVIERRYPLKTTRIKEVVHLDFYRLNADQLGGLDWLETVGQPGTLTLIEWPERVVKLLPSGTKSMKLEIIDDQTRRLTFAEDPSD